LSRIFIGNVGARVGALVSLALATLLVARTGGPTAVGIYALGRVVPGLVGVVIAAGLPSALTYFLAGARRSDRRLPLTIVAMALVAGAVGTGLWTAASPLIRQALFPDLTVGLVIVLGATVLAQLLVATAKSCSQGSDDMRGANWVILNEEFMFLPAYAVLWAFGVHGYEAAIVGLLLADVATFVPGWLRLARRGFFRDAEPPSLPLAREVAAYGMRAQVGGVILLLNLRLDFIVLNVLTGPAVVGIYAIASKSAELMKVPGMALTYVLYPEYAKEGRARATAAVRRLLPRAALFSVAGALLLAAAAPFVIPLAYGDAFRPAVVPAEIILVGLLLEGVTGMLSGFFYGVGRPGLNSWAMGAGLAVTIALDLALIPPFGVIGAAVASAVAYMCTTVALVAFFMRIERTAPRYATVDDLRGALRVDADVLADAKAARILRRAERVVDSALGDRASQGNGRRRLQPTSLNGREVVELRDATVAVAVAMLDHSEESDRPAAGASHVPTQWEAELSRAEAR
jgi:O-antigen/teichoic acid export membrane protein